MILFNIIWRTAICYLMIAGFFSCSWQRQSNGALSSDNINSVRYELVDDAREALGAGYRYGSTGDRSYDCSGLVYSLYSLQRISLPRSTRAMAEYGQKIKKEEILPGDLVFFRHARKIDHVALVSRISPSKTWLIHSTTSHGVIEQVLEESPYWSNRVDQYRRIIP